MHLANYYSSLDAFDHNVPYGFYDDAGNFYTRDSMRQLLNFHFRNGLDLNNDDDCD